MRSVDFRKARDVQCPVCKAKPGSPCFTLDGNSHGERWNEVQGKDDDNRAWVPPAQDSLFSDQPRLVMI